MKLYGNNRLLAEQLLEAAFGILRNEGLQPADCLALAYGRLAEGIDVTPVQKAALHGYLRQLGSHQDCCLTTTNETNKGEYDERLCRD